ncbi:hypothetical protein MXB_321 [Myxobolus squamalis]|nr:hypothetical protein MXB_321 [Myxobolus squamalis]
MEAEVGKSRDLLMKESTIKHLIEKDFKWIFVGGKGGVGKTTTRQNITDPAHNVADSLGQTLTNSPTLVKGFSNLYAMEIDSEASLGDCAMEITENQPLQNGHCFLF